MMLISSVEKIKSKTKLLDSLNLSTLFMDFLDLSILLSCLLDLNNLLEILIFGTLLRSNSRVSWRRLIDLGN